MTRGCFPTVLLLALGFVVPTARGGDPVDFQKEIRPILSDNCFNCHGPDEQSRKAGLRLDLREAALKGGKSGAPAIVPGNAEESDLIWRIADDDPNAAMPPAKTGKKLTPKQVELLRAWIDGGASYEGHWAFTPPKRPEVPAVKDSAWVRNPIDAFILARLEREGLHPSPEASKETLLRRLSLDLIGLPPTPEEVDAFLADESPDAYEKQVDRLLASPHYGERWGRIWLDAARYADSDGFEKDKPRSVWMYRDWVVGAFNRDLPYNQFVIEQLAGDLLPNATQDQRVATGFLRNSMINEEGGIDPEQFRMEAMFDRVDAIGKGILGLTVACAQCHTHKYDPITQEDYYRLFAFFNDTDEANIAVYGRDELARHEEIVAKTREIEEGLKAGMPDWRERMASWEEAAKASRLPWETVKVQNAGDNSQRYIYHEDGSQTAWGYAPTKWASQFTGKTDRKKITGIQLELLTDPNLPLNGPGRSPTGLFGLSELVVEVADAKAPDKKSRVKLIAASADFANDEALLDTMYDDRSNKPRLIGPVVFAIDGRGETAWGIDAGPGRRNVDRKAVFIPEKPIEFPEGAVFSFQVQQMHGGWNSDDNQNNNLGRFRFSVTDAPSPSADPLPKKVREILDIPAEQRTPEQVAEVFSYWRTTVPAFREGNGRIESLWRTHPVGASQLTMAAREKSRTTYLLNRGDFLKPEHPVVPAGLSAFPPLPAGSKVDRLALAKWMVSPEAPTTARAIVNRAWQGYFGTGLVSTAEDLGVQSEPPSHPGLLDWLAVEFVDQGWHFKALHRLIATSSTYRQSANATADLLRIDPDNRLLARASRHRVEGESVRDIALAVSGLLNLKMGGPPVHPPAPAFLFQPPASYGPKVWNEDHDAERYRRALYTFRFRSVPYPVLMNFDTPNGDASCVRRVLSNTPVQALTTLNEPLFLECARAFALKALAEGGDTDADRVAYAFRRATGRKPTQPERDVLVAFLNKQAEKFAKPEAKPWELAANDPAHPPELPGGATPAQAAAWTALSRLILNLDETITRE